LPNKMQQHGATPSKQTHFSPIWQNRFYDGIVTNRNPLSENASHVEEYYGGHGTALIDGLNTEISPRLSVIRRPGSLVYNSKTFPAIDRFYENRTTQFNSTQTSAKENIQVIADTASVIYDATGPSTKTSLFTKTANEPTYFQSVGNAMYFTTGTDLEKYITPNQPWFANTTYTVGDFIEDSNGNFQLFQSVATSLAITGVAIVAVTPGNISSETFLVLTLAVTPPVIPVGQPVTFSGMTTLPALNGTTITYQNISTGWGLSLTSQQIAFRYTVPPPVVLAISSFSGTSGTLTFSVPNTLSAGNSVYLSGFSGANAGLNGQQVTVLPTGLSTSQFEAVVTGSGYASGAGSGIAYATLAPVPETGAASTFIQNDQYGNPLTGISGVTQPTWATGQYGTTADGTINWTVYGTPVEPWQVAAPSTAPSVSQTGYNSITGIVPVVSYWSADKTLQVGLTEGLVIMDSNNNLEVPSSVLSGGSGNLVATYRPTTNVSSGHTLNPAYAYDTDLTSYASLTASDQDGYSFDSTASFGGFPSVTSGTPSTLSVVVSTNSQALEDTYCSITITVTMPSGTQTLLVTSDSLAQQALTVTVPAGTNFSNVSVSASCLAPSSTHTLAQASLNIYDISLAEYTTAIVPAVTGNNQPVWNTSLGGLTKDGTVVWENLGRSTSWYPSYQYPTQITVILDSNGNLQYTAQYFTTQTVWTSGVANTTGASNITGATEPTAWSTTIGGHTTDGAYTWTCLGPASQLTAGTLQYAYSYHCLDGSVTTASPVSYVLNPVLGYLGLFEILVVVPYSSSTQVDQIWLWRTTGGGSTLFYLDSLPNTSASGTVSYIDILPDASTSGGQALDQFISAPIDKSSDPPPSGLKYLTYHLGRIFGAVGNTVVWSQGPDVTSGNGNTAWSPSNTFSYPSTVIRLFPTSSGLVVFTTSDIYLIAGLGTAGSPLYSTAYLQYIGISSYDAFSVNGSVVYIYTTDNHVLCLDPNSGVSEVGFPIGDQFGPEQGTGTFRPLSSRVTWHVAGSQDKGLYVSDNQGSWWRLSPTASPETGLTWSPRAAIAVGFSAVQSVETSPGIHQLLIGPQTSGPILVRSYDTFEDNGVSYNAFSSAGSLVLAQPGQLALVQSITTDCFARGTPISLAVQLDEVSGDYFEPIASSVPDPTQLTPSNSLYAQRFYLSETQKPACCRHMQIKINFGTDSVQNELLSLTVVGGYEGEM